MTLFWVLLRAVQRVIEARSAPERSRLQDMQALWALPVIRDPRTAPRVLGDLATYHAWSERSRLRKRA